MKLVNLLGILAIILFTISCSRDKLEEKGFSVSNDTQTEEEVKIDGISQDSVKLETRPSSVLLTSYPEYRLTPIYKVNFNKRTETTFIGYNNFHWNYNEIGYSNGNQWNYNFMPGIEAAYGYNMVNIE